ncbi:hypothetical protein AB0J37_39265, partial [Microbispora rosea]
MAALLFVMVLETVAMDLLLRRFGLPDLPRLVILALDASSALAVLGVMVSCARRPHVVSPDGLRLRYGRMFGVDVPAELIASARIDRRYDEKRLVRLSDGELALAVSSQTNLVVELREPWIVLELIPSRTLGSVIREEGPLPPRRVAEIG